MLSNYLNDPENSFDISAVSHGLCLNTKHKQTQAYYLAISNQRWLWEPRPGQLELCLLFDKSPAGPSELWEMTFLMSGVGQPGLGLGQLWKHLEKMLSNMILHPPQPLLRPVTRSARRGLPQGHNRLLRASGSNMLRCLVQSKCNSRSEVIFKKSSNLYDHLTLGVCYP